MYVLLWHAVFLAWILRVAVAVYVFVIVAALYHLDFGKEIENNTECIISTSLYCYMVMQTWGLPFVLWLSFMFQNDVRGWRCCWKVDICCSCLLSVFVSCIIAQHSPYYARKLIETGVVMKSDAFFAIGWW